MLTQTAKASLFLCDSCIAPADWGYHLGAVGSDGFCARCGGLASLTFSEQVQAPQVGSWGQMDFTTSVVIAPIVKIVYDVNGYYAALGVRPDATKRELRIAYQRLQGWNSERLTYIIKKLLDDEARAAYDATMPGEVFFDIFVRRAIERKRHDEQAAMAHLIDEDDIPSERAYAHEADSFRRQLDEKMDKGTSTVDNLAYSEYLLHSGWGYYLWRSTRRDPDEIARWRALLIEACAQEGIQTNLSVGFAGGHLPLPWGLLRVGHRDVAFLRDGESSTPELAACVAALISSRSA